MAITLKDINEKDFTTAKNGYDMDEVDNFLDEIAEQVSELIKENMELKEQVKAAEATAAEAADNGEAKFDDSGYFKSLESAMRESLINAQRIAEETRKSAESDAAKAVSEAQTAAEAMTEEARQAAETMTSQAKAEVEACKAELKAVKEALAKYRAEFRALVDDQMELLKNTDALFE